MRLISGVQPSGNLTIGNYIGAIKNFVKLQNELPDADILVFIADLHAITVPQEKLALRNNIRNLAALYIACGLDPKRVHIFIQSEVPFHNQLGYVMECTGYIGELERMTQYKDKKKKQVEGIKVGLLTYPALMAADILLYDANIVPVGQDQTQHLELTRNLAERFNTKYGETFVVPEGYSVKVGRKVMSLVDPTKKMSKSDDNPKSAVYLLDDINTAKNKIKSAITDSDTKIKHDASKPGISNLLSIYAGLTDLSINDIEAKYVDSNYATFKSDLANIVGDFLTDLQAKFNTLVKSPELDKILDEGRDYACSIAYKKINKVYNKIGLGRKR